MNKIDESVKWTKIDEAGEMFVDESGTIFLESNIPELTILTPMPHIMPSFDGISRQYITPQQVLDLIPDKDK